MLCRSCCGGRLGRAVCWGVPHRPENTSVPLTPYALFVILQTVPRNVPKTAIHRPPRIRVPYQQRAIFTIDNEKLIGVVQRLSLTGGSAKLARGPIAESVLGEILFATAFGNVKAAIKFLHMGADGVPVAQAFVFVTMSAVSNQRLRKALEEMNTSEFSDDVGQRTQLGSAFEKLRQSAGQLAAMFTSARRSKT